MQNRISSVIEDTFSNLAANKLKSKYTIPQTSYLSYMQLFDRLQNEFDVYELFSTV